MNTNCLVAIHMLCACVSTPIQTLKLFHFYSISGFSITAFSDPTLADTYHHLLANNQYSDLRSKHLEDAVWARMEQF